MEILVTHVNNSKKMGDRNVTNPDKLLELQKRGNGTCNVLMDGSGKCVTRYPIQDFFYV
jgi:hypothetical protein